MDFKNVEWTRWQKPAVKEPTIEERLAEMDRRLKLLEAIMGRFSGVASPYPDVGTIRIGPGTYPGTTWGGGVTAIGTRTIGELRN